MKTTPKYKIYQTWVGMMCSSILSANTSAQILPLAGAGDLDGALLVMEESSKFQGGFEWQLGEILLTTAPGFGVTLKGS